MNICSQEQKSNTSDFCDRWSEDEPLGTTCIKAIDLVSRVDATIDSKSLIINTFPSFFQGVGDLREEYKIRLKPGATAHALFTPRHVPLPLRSKIQKELDRMESIGVIAKVDAPGVLEWWWCQRKKELSTFV